MIITLRKANALSEAAINAAKKLINTEFVVSIYEDISKRVSVMTTACADKLVTADNLLVIGYSIRGRAYDAGSAAGVHALLSEKASLDASEMIFSKIALARTQISNTEIAARMERLVERLKSDHYGHEDGVTVSAVTEAAKEAAKAKCDIIRRRKVVIADELLKINLNATITLLDDEVSSLETAGIL